MASIQNLTQFVPASLSSITKEGSDVLVVCVAGRFQLPPAGKPNDKSPEPCEKQCEPVIEDVYYGEPGKSSLKYEGQIAYTRPGTDIYLVGHAWAPRGRPAQYVLTGLKVGQCQKQVLVVGDRFWHKKFFWGAKSTDPVPFVSMPLQYERSFGGETPEQTGRRPQQEARNTVGCGFYRNVDQAANQPLPNLEDPKNLIHSIKDHPAPAGFGPIARNWQPRLGYGGTYDQAWIETRAPFWPLDFDIRFFQAASPGLNTGQHLTGGEPVTLQGFSPDGKIVFQLPDVRMQAKSVFNDCVEKQVMVLDAIQFEPDDWAMTLIWRTAISMHSRMHDHLVTIVRELEPWEEQEL